MRVCSESRRWTAGLMHEGVLMTYDSTVFGEGSSLGLPLGAHQQTGIAFSGWMTCRWALSNIHSAAYPTSRTRWTRGRRGLAGSTGLELSLGAFQMGILMVRVFVQCISIKVDVCRCNYLLVRIYLRRCVCWCIPQQQDR